MRSFLIIVVLPVLFLGIGWSIGWMLDSMKITQPDSLAKTQWLSFTNGTTSAVTEMEFIEGGETNIRGHSYRKAVILYHRVGCPCGGKKE